MAASQVAQLMKSICSMQETQETQFPSLDHEDLLEKHMATHASILSYKIPWTEEPAG